MSMGHSEEKIVHLEFKNTCFSLELFSKTQKAYVHSCLVNKSQVIIQIKIKVPIHQQGPSVPGNFLTNLWQYYTPGQMI